MMRALILTRYISTMDTRNQYRNDTVTKPGPLFIAMRYEVMTQKRPPALDCRTGAQSARRHHHLDRLHRFAECSMASCETRLRPMRAPLSIRVLRKEIRATFAGRPRESRTSRNAVGGGGWPKSCRLRRISNGRQRRSPQPPTPAARCCSQASGSMPYDGNTKNTRPTGNLGNRRRRFTMKIRLRDLVDFIIVNQAMCRREDL